MKLSPRSFIWTVGSSCGGNAGCLLPNNKGFKQSGDEPPSVKFRVDTDVDLVTVQCPLQGLH